MNILVLLFAAVSHSLAVKFPIRSSYSSALPTDHYAIRPQPIITPISTKSLSASSRQRFTSSPNPITTYSPTLSNTLVSSKSIFPPLPRRYSLPKSSSYSSPKPSYSSPKPSYSSPNPSYLLPKRSYSSPNPSYLLPKPSYSSPKSYYSLPTPKTLIGQSVVPILRDDRVHNEDGSYSFSLETGDGIKRQETGVPVYTKDGPVNSVTGSYSYILPDGQLFELSYVADENGFQPQSSFLPVGPGFPHPIPAHALEQIERGRREHEVRALKDRLKQQQQPSVRYAVSPKRRRTAGVYHVPF